MQRRRLTRLAFGLLILPLMAGTSWGQDDPILHPADSGAVWRAVERSLPYLEAEGLRWMKRRKCVSCHQIPAMLWSLHAAAERGFDVDTAKLGEWVRWSVDKVLAPHEKDGKIVGTKNVEGLDQLLISGVLARDSRAKPSAELEFVKLITTTQQADGSWLPGGQLPAQRRSKHETKLVSTAWAALALRGRAERSAVDSRKRSLAWLKSTQPGNSIETVILLLRVAASEDRASEVQRLGRQLLELQRSDGGWSWIRGKTSDALATGQSVHALLTTGVVEKNDRRIFAASRFLLRTQGEDGTWTVLSTLARKEGEDLPTSNYWGTAWAALGLLQTLPDRVQRF